MSTNRLTQWFDITFVIISPSSKSLVTLTNTINQATIWELFTQGGYKLFPHMMLLQMTLVIVTNHERNTVQST